MHLYLRNTNGSLLNVNASSVDGLKSSINKEFGISTIAQKLLFNGEELKNLDIPEYSTIDLNAELLGGGKKKKKKTYTTPKKIKHKRKKVKLAIIKYYKVDSNGNLSRLRRECVNSNCGAGTFMANHVNRQYCGKCHLTMIPDAK